jgi:hypothetical protein
MDSGQGGRSRRNETPLWQVNGDLHRARRVHWMEARGMYRARVRLPDKSRPTSYFRTEGEGGPGFSKR